MNTVNNLRNNQNYIFGKKERKKVSEIYNYWKTVEKGSWVYFINFILFYIFFSISAAILETIISFLILFIFYIICAFIISYFYKKYTYVDKIFIKRVIYVNNLYDDNRYYRLGSFMNSRLEDRVQSIYSKLEENFFILDKGE